MRESLFILDWMLFILNPLRNIYLKAKSVKKLTKIRISDQVCEQG